MSAAFLVAPTPSQRTPDLPHLVPAAFRARPAGPSTGHRLPPAGAISKHLSWIQPPNGKKLLCAGQGQELSVSIAVPPLSKLSLHKFHLCAIRQNRGKDFLKKSILWIFQDPQVIHLNQTACGMMSSIEILIEHCCGWNFWLPQGQEHLAEVWELMQQFYLIL